MVIVALIGILSTMAVGLSVEWRRVNTFHAVARDIYSCLGIARGHALRALFAVSPVAAVGCG